RPPWRRHSAMSGARYDLHQPPPVRSVPSMHGRPADEVGSSDTGAPPPRALACPPARARCEPSRSRPARAWTHPSLPRPGSHQAQASLSSLSTHAELRMKKRDHSSGSDRLVRLSSGPSVSVKVWGDLVRPATKAADSHLRAYIT